MAAQYDAGAAVCFMRRRINAQEGGIEYMNGNGNFQDTPAVSGSRRPTGSILFIAYLLILILSAGWILLTIHPNIPKREETEARPAVNDLSRRLDLVANNLKSDALSDIVYIRKQYRIPEDSSVAPLPAESGFGETADPAVIQAVIDNASELLEGQHFVWTQDRHFFSGSTIKYYSDDTILAIVWKEKVGNRVLTFAEVKVADGSQLRRALAGDSYSSSIQLKASDMAKAVNAVVAINGDFYAFRKAGVVVYKRNLFRFSPSSLDTCFFTASGDMLFSHAKELTSPEETEKYIQDNDIIFSTSFGPILVENGEIYHTEYYPVGEISNIYARSAIGKIDNLHYLLMVTSTETAASGMRASDAARIMYDNGCYMAYELDGGQTAVIVFNGSPANKIVFGSERTMSDIVYFASAIPNTGD